MTDIETRLRETMLSVADTTAIPPAPRAAPGTIPLRHRLGRRVTAVIAAGGISVIGLGTAAATGVLTPGADKAFSDWDNVNPRDAILVAELPGPLATKVAAYQAPQQGSDQTCIAFIVFNDSAYGDHGVGGECSKVDSGDLDFGRSGGSDSGIQIPGYETITIFAMAVGRGVTADVEYDGKSHNVAVANGYAVGWVPDSQWSAATLTARDATGAVVGEIDNLGSGNGRVGRPSSWRR